MIYSKLKVLEIGHDPAYVGEWIVNRSVTIRCRKGSRMEEHCKTAGFDVEYLE